MARWFLKHLLHTGIKLQVFARFFNSPATPHTTVGLCAEFEAISPLVWLSGFAAIIKFSSICLTLCWTGCKFILAFQ